MMKNPKEILTLKRFMLRSEVLKLYRNCMKVGRSIENINGGTESAKALRSEWTIWIREEFKLRKNETDEEIIGMLIGQGKRQLSELERSVHLGAS